MRIDLGREPRSPDAVFREPPTFRDDMEQKCGLPPTGWECSRNPGHDGPCAALPVVQVADPDGVCYSYPVTNKQAEQARVWEDAHDKAEHIPPGKKHRYSGAIGGAYTWHFTSTSLGVITSLRCSCGVEVNLTDWDTFG